MNFFPYEEHEIHYLKNKDKRLKVLIETIGPMYRPVDTDLFESLISSIVSQQITRKAAETVFNRLVERFDKLNVLLLAEAPLENIQEVGLSFRKAQNIKTIARLVLDGELNLKELEKLPDHEVKMRLIALPGIGPWTAEMLLIFALLRKDVFSIDDFGIRQGVMKLYHHKEVTKKQMERYKKRYSPYGSLASLYLWALASNKELQL